MKHCIFDTETSNLIHNSLQPIEKQPKVIEFFALVLDDQKDWAEVETLHSLFDPGIPLDKKITEITGLTNEALRGKPKFSEVMPEISRLMQSSDCVVAHNLSFDIAIVNFEARRLGLQVPWPVRKVCTVEATEAMKGYRLNLMALHTELFGVGFEKAHSAEHDVRATARCYVELVRRGEV